MCVPKLFGINGVVVNIDLKHDFVSLTHCTDETSVL